MKIEWNKVTWYSRALAYFLFVLIFGVGIALGYQLGSLQSQDYKKYLLLSYTRHVPAELKVQNPDQTQQAELAYREKIIGSWQNDSNINQVVNYNKQGLAAVFAQDKPITTFTWSIEETNGDFFIKENGPPDRYYKILNVDDQHLKIEYMFNNKVLSYTRK